MAINTAIIRDLRRPRHQVSLQDAARTTSDFRYFTLHNRRMPIATTAIIGSRLGRGALGKPTCR